MSFYQPFQAAHIDVQVATTNERVQVLADTVCMQRILTNMFSNIVKHAVSSVSIHMEVEHQQVCLHFRNDIKDEVNVDALFERFYTADHARSFANTGLGLAIVKELVEKFSGSVKGEVVEQTLCITLSFPIY